MKKSKAIIAITALAILATAVAIVSCKKDKQEQSIRYSDNMNEYLISFKEKLLSAEKGDEFISIEQAQRDLGNLLNFDFGDANYASNIFHYDTLRTKLAITDGMVDMYQLSETYGVAREMIAKAYAQENLPEKSISAILCTIDHEIIDNEVNLVFVVTVRGFDLGEKSMTTVPLGKSSIDSTDCWHVARSLGRCDNTDVGHDHSTILELVYNNNIPFLACGTGTHLYYTDITDESFYAFEVPEFGSTFYNLGYRLWRGYYNGWNSGLVPFDEMNYYYENLCDIIEDKMDALNDNEYKIINISCTVVSEPYDHTYYSFLCKYEYGKPHCGDGTIN